MNNKCSNMKTVFSIALIVVSLSVFAQKTEYDYPYGKDSFKIGEKLPDFEGVSLNNKIWNNETLKGKVVLINFWYIGCLPCMAEINHLNSLYAHYKNKDFILLSIALNRREDLLVFNGEESDDPISKLRKIFKAGKINYEIIPACSDSLKRNLSMSDNGDKIITLGNECKGLNDNFVVNSYPTTIIIDKNGIIRFKKSGFDVVSATSESDIGNVVSKVIDSSATKISLNGKSHSIIINNPKNGQNLFEQISKEIDQLLNE